MKKLLSLLILSVVLVVSSVGVLPASAEGGTSIFDGTKENIDQSIREYFAIPAANKVFIGSVPSGNAAVLYFVEVQGYHQAILCSDTTDPQFKLWDRDNMRGYVSSVMKFLDENGDPEPLTVISHAVFYSENRGYYETTSSYTNCYSYFFCNAEGIARYRCLIEDEFERVSYNMLQPPDVFTYSITPSNFTLRNGGVGSVTVNFEFTPQYLNWLNTAHNRGLDIDGRYNVCVWVSDVCPTASNSGSVLNSMNASRFTKLHYGNYLYDGYPNEQMQSEQHEEAPTSNYDLYPLKIVAEGVCVSAIIDPAQETNQISFLSENILGFDSHTPIYVCCLGAYSGFQGGNVSAPDMYNSTYMTGICANGDINSTYADYSVNNGNVRMHTYWFPFSSASSAVGDGYQGECTYKPQTVNGQDYQSGQPVTELTNKSQLTTPDRLHDNRMQEDQWVKPEDYKQWQTNWENEHQYGGDFAYDSTTLRELLNQESDFFALIKASFSCFPAYVMNIFTAFIFAILAVIIVKRII